MTRLALASLLLGSVIAIFVALAIRSCLPDEKARQTVMQAGYTEVRINWTFLEQCAGATEAFEFSALDSTKSYVHGVVCCKWDFGCVLSR